MSTTNWSSRSPTTRKPPPNYVSPTCGAQRLIVVRHWRLPMHLCAVLPRHQTSVHALPKPTQAEEGLPRRDPPRGDQGRTLRTVPEQICDDPAVSTGTRQGPHAVCVLSSLWHLATTIDGNWRALWPFATRAFLPSSVAVGVLCAPSVATRWAPHIESLPLLWPLQGISEQKDRTVLQIVFLHGVLRQNWAKPGLLHTRWMGEGSRRTGLSWLLGCA